MSIVSPFTLATVLPQWPPGGERRASADRERASPVGALAGHELGVRRDHVGELGRRAEPRPVRRWRAAVGLRDAVGLAQLTAVEGLAAAVHQRRVVGER